MRWFQPENAPKAFGGRAPSGPAGELTTLPQTIRGREKGRGKRKDRKQWRIHGGTVGAIAPLPPDAGRPPPTVAIPPSRYDTDEIAYIINTLAKNWVNFVVFWDVQEPKSFQLQQSSPPDPPPGALTPNRTGAPPQTPVTGSRSTRSPWAPPHNENHWIRPWQEGRKTGRDGTEKWGKREDRGTTGRGRRC